MLRVTIDLVPFGIESEKKTLHVIEIANTGKGTKTRGNYTYRLSKRGMPNVLWKQGRIEDFPRLSRNSYDLLYRVLKAVVGNRN